jgi:hypothetical protein
MKDKKKLCEEIYKTKIELVMSKKNDGWWNIHMKEKLNLLVEELKKLNLEC